MESLRRQAREVRTAPTKSGWLLFGSCLSATSRPTASRNRVKQRITFSSLHPGQMYAPQPRNKRSIVCPHNKLAAAHKVARNATATASSTQAMHTKLQYHVSPTGGRTLHNTAHPLRLPTPPPNSAQPLNPSQPTSTEQNHAAQEEQVMHRSRAQPGGLPLNLQTSPSGALGSPPVAGPSAKGSRSSRSTSRTPS